MEENITVRVRRAKPTWAEIKIKDVLSNHVDMYTIGVYIRLWVLAVETGRLEDIYAYGSRENIDKALDRLRRLKWIQQTDGNTYLDGIEGETEND